MGLRPSLLIGGHDPATAAGRLAFLALDNPSRARYLKSIEYLEGDVADLLSLLSDDDRREVLAYHDDYASELAWP